MARERRQTALHTILQALLWFDLHLFQDFLEVPWHSDINPKLSLSPCPRQQPLANLHNDIKCSVQSLMRKWKSSISLYFSHVPQPQDRETSWSCSWTCWSQPHHCCVQDCTFVHQRDCCNEHATQERDFATQRPACEALYPFAVRLIQPTSVSEVSLALVSAEPYQISSKSSLRRVSQVCAPGGRHAVVGVHVTRCQRLVFFSLRGPPESCHVLTRRPT